MKLRGVYFVTKVDIFLGYKKQTFLVKIMPGKSEIHFSRSMTYMLESS